jgi:sugar phosphate isomerase/epimerase
MKRIFAHHIADWLVPTRDLLLDRGMMGDGVIDFKKVRSAFEQAGYFGPQEVEIFSALDWWRRPGREVLQTCIDRYLDCCIPEPSAEALSDADPHKLGTPITSWTR